MEETMVICVSSPMEIDEVLMAAWTQGLSQQEAMQMKLKENQFVGFAFRNESRQQDSKKLIEDLIRKDVMDQYRCFEFLEHYFQNPLLLQQQAIIEVKLASQNIFVSYYWSVDDAFLKEMLVAKKPIKSRKDLDDIAESTGLNLRRVTRQFDNLKRLYSAVDESKNSWQCNIANFLQSQYALNSALSTRYACVLFLQVAKFSLVSKKRLQRVRCEVLEHCAAAIMSCLNTGQDMFYNNPGDGQASSLASPAHRYSVSSNMTSPSAFASGLAPTSLLASNTVASGSGAAAAGAVGLYANMIPPSNAIRVRERESSLWLVEPGDIPIGAALPPSDDLLVAGYEGICWNRIWHLFLKVESIDIDKQLLASLREIRNVLTGDLVDVACNQVRQMMSSAMYNPAGTSQQQQQQQQQSSGVSQSPPKLSFSEMGIMTSQPTVGVPVSSKMSIKKLLEGQRVRTVFKALLQIGANLSQSREYRDLLEDLLTKVAEPLEEVGVHGNDMQIFLVSCMYALRSIAFSNKGHRPASSNVNSVTASGLPNSTSSTNTAGYQPESTSSRGRTDTMASIQSAVSNNLPGYPMAGNLNQSPSSNAIGASDKGEQRSVSAGNTDEALLIGSQLPASGSTTNINASFGQSNINFIHRSSSSVSSLVNDVGLTGQVSSSGVNRGEMLRKDWIRFITCCRLCLHQLTK